jgi:hypothetical protein
MILTSFGAIKNPQYSTCLIHAYNIIYVFTNRYKILGGRPNYLGQVQGWEPLFDHYHDSYHEHTSEPLYNAGAMHGHPHTTIV